MIEPPVTAVMAATDGVMSIALSVVQVAEIWQMSIMQTAHDASVKMRLKVQLTGDNHQRWVGLVASSATVRSGDSVGRGELRNHDCTAQ